MRQKASAQVGPEIPPDRPFPSRREVLAAAAALIGAGTSISPAGAATGAEGYFLAFDSVQNNPTHRNLDRLFFIPSAWLELFEVTDVYKARYSEAGWQQALSKLRGAAPHGRKLKFSALYSDSTHAGVAEPFPDLTVISPVPPSGTQTYLAALVSPPDIP